MSSRLPSLLTVEGVKKDEIVVSVVVHGLQYIGEDAVGPWSELSK